MAKNRYFSEGDLPDRRPFKNKLLLILGIIILLLLLYLLGVMTGIISFNKDKQPPEIYLNGDKNCIGFDYEKHSTAFNTLIVASRVMGEASGKANLFGLR